LRKDSGGRGRNNLKKGISSANRIALTLFSEQSLGDKKRIQIKIQTKIKNRKQTPLLSTGGKIALSGTKEAKQKLWGLMISLGGFSEDQKVGGGDEGGEG